LVVNSVLLEEYRSWLNKLSSKLLHTRGQAETLYTLIISKAVSIEPDHDHIEQCKPFILEGEYADLYHATTCLKANAILVTNDKDFDRIAKTDVIKVWSITRAVRELLKGEHLRKRMLFTIMTYTPTLIQALYSVSSLKTGRSDLAFIKDSASVKN